MKAKLIILNIAAMTGIASAATTTVNMDFSGEALAKTTAPTGWNYVVSDLSNAASPGYVVGAGNTDNAGYVTGRSSNRNLSGGYITNSGMTAFDVNSDITGSFKFYIDGGDAPNYKNAQFFIGDTAAGVWGQPTIGQVIGAQLERNTFGNRAGINLGDGNAPTTKYKIEDGSWYTATFAWTASGSGNTGDFSLDVTGAFNFSATATNYTFDSNEAFVAFGVGGYSSNDGTARFDDISITGTVIPEPSSVMLLGLGGLALIARRRR